MQLVPEKGDPSWRIPGFESKQTTSNECTKENTWNLYEIIFCVPVFDCILLILIALVSFLAVQKKNHQTQGWRACLQKGWEETDFLQSSSLASELLPWYPV